MPQIFHPSSNTFSKLSIFGALFVVGGGLYGLAVINRSPYVTQAGVAREQPVPFSHKHHAGELGIDCRYCHNFVERSKYAGVPPTQTCMNCHSKVKADSPVLEPVRSSWNTGESIEWTKIYDLPDFVYFNHSIHIAKGIGCVSCHGRIDKMNLTAQQPSLHMEWCLECHRDPARYVRPRSEVFNMDWQPPADDPAFGEKLVAAHDIRRRDDCTTCHR
jgi:Cytochrome c7 and related cytochrome c